VQAAAFTLLNPHVYVDTVLLVGSIGALIGVTMWVQSLLLLRHAWAGL
jgi:arginine exporter protein ArgO